MGRAAAGFGFAGSIVAARVFSVTQFGVFMTALAVVGFFQTLLDLTVEESLTKYGFRYVSTQDWGRLRRLFRQAFLIKIVGGALATLIVLALAPAADAVFDEQGVGAALVAASLLPLVQASENKLLRRARRRMASAPGAPQSIHAAFAVIDSGVTGKRSDSGAARALPRGSGRMPH